MNPAQRQLASMLIDLVGYEMEHFSDEMLISEEFDRLIARWPIAGRVLVVAVGAIVTAHLANLVDDRYDLMASKFWARALRRRRPVVLVVEPM